MKHPEMMHDSDDRNSIVDGASDYQVESVTPNISRKRILGLALFSLSQAVFLWIFAPYAFSISSPTNLPPEMKGISGPALMFVWGITGGSFLLLVSVVFAFLFKRSSTFESLALWAKILMGFSIYFCICYLYMAIHDIYWGLIFAVVMLVSAIYHRTIVWLLSDSCTKKTSKNVKK